MPNFAQLAEQYIAAWNETRPAARRKLIAEVYAEHARYTDPLIDVCGRDQIDAAMAAVQEQFAGLTFRLAGPVDAHHDQARFAWELGPSGSDTAAGTPLVVGFDVAERDADGRLTRVLGFLDRVPNAPGLVDR